MSVLRLVIDRQNKQLVNYLGSVIQLPALFQTTVPTLQIGVVDPTGNVMAPYSLVDLTGYGLRASVGDTPTGTAGGPAPLALQDTFVWNAATKYFSADLSLTGAAIDSFIGSLASRGAYFEINLTLNGNRDVLLQIPVTLKAVVDELTSTAPGPTDQYLTKAECLALFAKLIMDLGQRQVFRSANGVYGREIGVNDDGSALDNLINL
jgi:hypothetical protein